MFIYSPLKRLRFLWQNCWGKCGSWSREGSESFLS